VFREKIETPPKKVTDFFKSDPGIFDHSFRYCPYKNVLRTFSLVTNRSRIDEIYFINLGQKHKCSINIYRVNNRFVTKKTLENADLQNYRYPQIYTLQVFVLAINVIKSYHRH
jgi:hypothetical protein